MRTFPLAAILALAVSVPVSAQDELEPLVAELTKLKDDADEELIVQIADLKTREAMEALVSLYDKLGSTFMKREVVRALATFDGVDEAEQPAMQKVADVATASDKRILRLSAVEALGGARHLGKVYLKLIVDSNADDEVREMAFDLHTGMAQDSDTVWYRGIYEARLDELKDLPKRKRKQREEELAGEQQVHRLESLRQRAFAAVAGGLTDAELLDALEEDENERIQLHALEVLHSRGSKKVESAATEMFEDIQRKAEHRAIAARVLAEREGPAIAARFITFAKKQAVTQDYLRQTMAELLSAMQDPKLDTKLEKLLGKGKTHEKTFALRACRRIEDPKLDKKFVKALREKDDDVWMVVVQIVGERGIAEAIPELEEQLEEAEQEGRILALLGALSALYGDDPAWLARLEGYAKSGGRDLRNATLRKLATSDSAYYPLLIESLSHADWSTRLVALHTIEELRLGEGVGPILERMPREEGRMLHAFADTLWSLTGEPFGLRLDAWKSWWQREGAEFEVISVEELALREAEEEARRLRQVTTAGTTEFFGIQIVSHRVLFIIDVSGSMMENLRGEFVGELGEVRFDVARRELKNAIADIDPTALFNIITFSGGAATWVDGVTVASDENKAAAYEHIQRLGAAGGTNVYGALSLAFEDPDVDTIVFLSDGEPSVGEITDEYRLRETVAEWNANRGIQIHTVSVGGTLQLLSWLAEDHGGSYVEYD